MNLRKMNLRKSMLALAFASSCALAALPSTMLFQGHMPGADGSKAVEVRLYDAAADGTLAFKQSFPSVAFVNGYFAVELSSLPAFDKPLFAEFLVAGEASSTRIPLTLAPYAARAAVADSAAKADLAVNATHASDAVNATYAKSAESADVAINATNATYATTAGSAEKATSATFATTAAYATDAGSAEKATTATFATTAAQATAALGLAPSVNTLALHGDANGIAHIDQDVSEGSSDYHAGMGLNAKAQEAYIALSSGGNGSGGGANMTVKMDRITLGSSADYMGVQMSSVKAVSSAADLPTCNAENRGLMVMVHIESKSVRVTADSPAWCQYKEFPGGSEYKWAFMDVDGWKMID